MHVFWNTEHHCVTMKTSYIDLCSAQAQNLFTNHLFWLLMLVLSTFISPVLTFWCRVVHGWIFHVPVRPGPVEFVLNSYTDFRVHQYSLKSCNSRLIRDDCNVDVISSKCRLKKQKRVGIFTRISELNFASDVTEISLIVGLMSAIFHFTAITRTVVSLMHQKTRQPS